MFPGTLFYKDASGARRYSTPFPRRGLAALFTAEAIQVVGSPTISIEIEHKNYDETTWGAAGSFSSITTEGVYSQDVTTIKQQVRIAVVFSAGSTGDIAVLDIRPEGISWRP